MKTTSESAEGVVERAKTYTGLVRSRAVRILLLDYEDEPISNAQCKVTFEDGQTLEVESDSEGIIEFSKKAEGEVEIELVERKDNST